MSVSWSVEQPILTAFSFLGFLLATIPLTWQLEAWNVGCSLYGIWTGLTCLIQFTNHTVWKSDAINRAPIWCDIAIRISFVGPIGILSAALVIARRVSIISTEVQAYPGAYSPSRRRMVFIDLAIALSFPAAQLIIFYFIQGHRYDIYEGVGCFRAIPNSILAICLSTAWPLMISLISAAYCVSTLRVFYKRRSTFTAFLLRKHRITFHRYCRLVLLATVEMMFGVPLSIYILVESTAFASIYPWRGFADLHLHFDRVRQYPVAVWTGFQGIQPLFEQSEWFVIGCAIVYFFLFGLAEEARTHYISGYNTIARSVGLPAIDTTAKFTSFGSASFWFATHETWPPSRGESTEGDFLDDGDSEKALHSKDLTSDQVGATIVKLPPPKPIYSPAFQ